MLVQSLVLKDLKDHKVHRVQLVLKDHKVHRVQLVLKVHLV
jgi:hypothetical protein